MLPSEVIGRANTFDVFIADTAIGYRNVVQERAMNGDKKPTQEYKQSDLQQMLDKVRAKS